MRDNLTAWYPGHIRPAYRGVYQRERNSIILYSYWDGNYWNVGAKDPETALLLRTYLANHQQTPWRGICKTPK